MTAAQQPALIITNESGLLTLTLNRPDNANALNSDLVESLIDVLATVRDVQLCVIRGQGRHFCAGFDLSDLDTVSDGDLLWRFLRIETLLQSVYHAPFATVALAHGQVVGAGADLFAACWRRVASSDFKLKMPGWNFELALGTRRLTHLIGADAARDLLIDTKQFSTDDCLSCGLVTDVCNPQEWSALIEILQQRCSALPQQALRDMLNLTTCDSRNDDIAAIVKTAGRPGLKHRIQAYREKLMASKFQTGKS